MGGDLSKLGQRFQTGANLLRNCLVVQRGGSWHGEASRIECAQEDRRLVAGAGDIAGAMRREAQKHTRTGMQELELAQPREVRGRSAAVVRRQNVPALGELVLQTQSGVAIYASTDFPGRDLEARLGLDSAVGAPCRDRWTFVPLACRDDELAILGGECSVVSSAVEERRR